MADLTSKKRKSLPESDFGLPGERKYPMPDKAHARDAKSRASAAEHEGHLSHAQEEKIDYKADRILARGKGFRNLGHKEATRR